MALRLLASEEGEGEDSEARLLSNASAFEAPTGVQEGSTKGGTQERDAHRGCLGDKVQM